MAKTVKRFHDRDVSWLAFNARVLQEAADPTVPLIERLRFLAIFSSNLDEFYRVRIASLRAVLRLKKKKQSKLDFNPRKTLKQLLNEVVRQQKRFGAIFANEILPELEENGIEVLIGGDLTSVEETFVRQYFDEHVTQHIEPVVMSDDGDAPFLQNAGMYLVVDLRPEHAVGGTFTAPETHYGLVRIPSHEVPRFVELPSDGSAIRIMFLDDIMRANLPRIFPETVVGKAFAIKMTRDAELYIDDEFSGNLVDLIRKSVKKRETGIPTRLLYDLRMPYDMIAKLKTLFRLEEDDIVLGGRYHNFSDFFSFPDFGKSELRYPPMPSLSHPAISLSASILKSIEQGDLLFHFPYHAFDAILKFFRDAAEDPTTTEIWVTLYRVARDSRVTASLIEAARRGVRVTAFVEVKARFDEQPNLDWAEQMESAGVRVLYSIPGIKVHAKLALVRCESDGHVRQCAYLGTGNFNERTALVYADHGLLTCHPEITADVEQVFSVLDGRLEEPSCTHLKVAPFQLRGFFQDAVDLEIANARMGNPAWMRLKMNGLEDSSMIEKLYEASAAGVKVDLSVRGICRLIAGKKGLSENIRATSIVDRFLEHAREYTFCNGGSPVTYLASADWMQRNLSRRIEVAFPVLDSNLRRELEEIAAIQARDNRKARIIDAKLRNKYVTNDAEPCRAQIATYAFLASRIADRRSTTTVSTETQSVLL